MGRLSLVASNPVKDGIDAFTALSANYRADDAAKLAEAKDARDATTAGLQNQATQNQLAEYNNQQQDRQAGAIRMKVSGNIPLSPEEQAQAEQMSGVSQDLGTPVQQGIPLAMPADPRAATMQAAKTMAPSPLWKTPDNMTPEQESNHNALINTYSKMNQNPDYVPTKDEYSRLVKEVVNNPAFSDSGLAEQHAALDKVNTMFSQLKGITQPTLITDPTILDAVHVAFPRIGGDSNLSDATPTKIYVQPSPDGNPANARLTIGVSGTNDQGEVVDGVVTHNRSSDPNDTVMTVTGGAWMDMAQKKKQTLDGLLAYQAEHGNKEALPIYEQAQSNRELATRMIGIAGTMPDGSTAQKKLYGEAQMLMSGKIAPAVASATIEKVYHPEEVAAAAAQAQQHAIELKKMEITSNEGIHSGNNAAAIKGRELSLEGVKYAADVRERGDDNRMARTQQKDDSKEVQALISANTKLQVSITSKTGTMTTVDPLTQTPVVKNYSLDSAALQAAQAQILENNQRIDQLRGVKPRQAIPVAPPPAATPPANRPPLTSFKH